MIHIAIIGSRGYPSTYGGFETFVRHLAPFLRDEGHQVTVYGRSQGLRTTREMINGIEVVCTPSVESKSLSTLSSGLSGTIHATFRQRPDVVLMLNCANGLFLPFLRAGRIPVAVNVDGLEWERAKWKGLARQMFLLGARTTKYLASERIYDGEALSLYWNDRFKATGVTIPYGSRVVKNSGTSLLEDARIPNKYVLSVGRLVPENNLEMLLDAWQSSGQKFHLVIVGSTTYSDPMREKLATLDKEESELNWLGHVDDQELLSQLWANATVYFHGHSVGGTNPGLLEALGHGAPTIAFDTPFNREVMGSAGLFISTTEDLASMIDKLWDDDVIRNEIAANGQSRMAEHYRWPDICNSYQTLLESLPRK